MTATVTKKPKRADIATIPSGLAIPNKFVHDDAGQRTADRVNGKAATLAKAIVEHFEHRDEILTSAWDMPLRVLVANGAEFKRERAELLQDIMQHLVELQAALPSFIAGCRAAIDEAEADYYRCIDQLEETSRAAGVDEFSLPGGEHAADDMEGARELLRRRLGNDPQALARMAVWNRAKDTYAVLQSMLPRTANSEWAASYLSYPVAHTDLPAFVVNLFSETTTANHQQAVSPISRHLPNGLPLAVGKRVAGVR